MISIPAFKPLLLSAGIALGLSASLSGFAEDSTSAAD